jgi:hypothetical protein
MLSLGVKSSLAPVAAAFDRMAKGQVPYATSLAINRVAEFARDALRSNMQVVFDRPTPFILNSLFIKYANKSNLTAVVGHRDNSRGTPASASLQAEIEGGGRRLKSTEKLAGAEFVPARSAKLDAYGNLPSGTVKLMRQAIAQGYAAQGSREYVFIKPGNTRGLAPGVYQRVQAKVKISGRKGQKQATKSGGQLIPIAFMVVGAKYEKRYDMQAVVGRTITSQFGQQFAAAMDYALANARVQIKP